VTAPQAPLTTHAKVPLGSTPPVYNLGFASAQYVAGSRIISRAWSARPVEPPSSLEPARASGHVHGMLLKRRKGDDLQRQLVGGG